MDTPVRPGDVLLGKYRVERVLGRGGMGIVVAARHLDLDETFAIKFLLPEALSIPLAVERFLREARASARLKGEHVAKVHDVGRLESGAPYMVMEHLDGSDLKTLLRSRGPLPVDEAVMLMLQACDALEEAHSLGIVHRDLKPANLFLIRRPNGTPCLKVLDFGISKQLAQDNEGLTATGDVLGTPGYMPPEQMLRLKDADPRSDLWAIGVILYELVTGTRPFHAESMPEVVARVLQEEPPPPSGWRNGLPAWLDAVVGRCLQKRPEQRFQSVGELAWALRSQGRDGGGAAAAGFPRSGPISGRQAVIQSSPSLSTELGWGNTGAGTRPARNAGKVTAVIAAGLGLTLFLIGAVWVFVGRGPAQGASEPDRAAASPAAEARPPEAPSIVVAPTSAEAPTPPLAGGPNAKSTAEGAAPEPSELPDNTASSAKIEAPRAPTASPKTSPKAATKPAAKPASTYDGLY